MTNLRLADLSDKELEDLHGNAIRLAQSGTGAQRAEAERLLPAIGREVEARAQARSQAQRQKRAREKKQDGLKSGAGKTGARKAASTPVTTGVASNAGIRLNPKR